jgi:peptidoglycan/xylan/chitin deacetylase (PgdA/CDA1 family)
MKTPNPRQRALALAIAIALSLLLAGCGNSSTGSSGNGGATPIALIAPWPGTARAAYSITMDDFCGGATGIYDFADTILANRGLAMTFGAIVGSCQSTHWEQARQMIARGHEIMNHSMSHKCGTFEAGWCEDTWGAADFALELDASTATIEAQSGQRPRFFIFPYDLHTDEMLTYLRDNLEYFGARGGTKRALNGENFDPFRPNFDVNFPRVNGALDTSQAWELDPFVSAVAAQGGWAVRELHGVGDGSWGTVDTDLFRAHADFVASQVAAGLLWMAPPGRVIQYHDQRNRYQLAMALDTALATVTGALPGAEPWLLSWVGDPLPARYMEPLTLLVTGLPEARAWNVQPALGAATRIARLDGAPYLPGDTLRITAHPSWGAIRLTPEPVVAP